uniref:Tyrosine-protein kinase n=1 Tax=Gouania willdenowi TaxID=441366 RepID=A0A8C5D9S8_GOUWI
MEGEEESTPLVLRDRGDSQRSSSSSSFRLQVHLYFIPGLRDATTLILPPGQISTESVCIQAGEKCGILPVHLSLFGLASTDLSFWYPPSHMFDADENIHVHFRVRFFFENWFGQGARTSYRYSMTRDKISPVLDCSVIDYLFAQVNISFFSHAYKSCLPKTHRQDIQRRNRLDRFRIRNILKRFLKKLSSCSVDDCSLKLNYLIELAGVVPSLGSETFLVNHSSSQSMSTFSYVKVNGETGIQTSASCHTGEATPSTTEEQWRTFCDFSEIIDISIKRVSHEKVLQDNRIVTITRKDDRCMEAMFQSLKEAISFVSLVDGYFRLTTDSSHFFCQDIAPPSLLEGLENHYHGPIISEFAVNKLKKSGHKGGAFVLRQSPKTYNNFFLTVCIQRVHHGHDCRIIKNGPYSIPGVKKTFSSLKCLTSYYQHNKLLLADVPVKLGHCCPPRPKELTNLIIMRTSSSVEAQGSPTPERNKFSHIQFHTIKYEDLKWDESLGQGSFTRIYKGYRTDIRDGEKHCTEVLLKELDACHKNCWESFFESASLMSQISHKHLLLVYGVSVHGEKNIMVQEFVKYGALDLYLKRGKTVSVSWKLDVAKQLASALNFLEEKNIVHGNICAKNLLLAREGDSSQGISPFIKLSDPGISLAMLGKHVLLDRIPWVAPEVLISSENLTLECDKWSFGATVWEVFNNGNSPLKGYNLKEVPKRRFYETFQRLPPSQWAELADLINHCMDYQADFRPSCRCIIRQLNSLITSDYEILHSTEPVAQSPRPQDLSPVSQDETLLEERHLRYVSLLGKGNFGTVELCCYDPMGDNTGELVAVKKLQPNKHSTLEDFQKEVKTLSALHCDYIVKYRGVCYSMGRLTMSLVMEYLPYGSLIGYMENHRNSITIKRMLLFAFQICKGMEHLQTQRYVHRDLAARNILVASDSLVKIADFGLTKVIPSDKEYYRVTQPGESPIFWYAPESIGESRFSHKSDIWSFGVVLHELFSYCDINCNPKRLCMQEIGPNVQGTSISMLLLNALKNNWRLPVPPNCPPKVCSLIKQCWEYDFKDRPCFFILANQIETIMQDERENSKG